MFTNSIIARKNSFNSKRWNEDMIDLFGQTFDPPVDYIYKVISVDREHTARPDLISRTLYGSYSYGDLICRLNGIANPFEVNEGDILVVPDLDEIDKFFITPEVEDTIYDLEDQKPYIQDKPSYKKPKEKRKPNEAILGDSRFKIDKTNRVIIY